MHEVMMPEYNKEQQSRNFCWRKKFPCFKKINVKKRLLNGNLWKIRIEKKILFDNMNL